MPRDASASASASATSSGDVHASDCAAAAESAEKNASADSATADADCTLATPQHKPKKKSRRLRCGWMITADQQFLSPDGKTFSSRKEASRYFNQHVPKLEPERQDGWQVYVDASNTHVTWIAPDGQKLSSFVGAKTYASTSKLDFFAKDGRTKSIASFFGGHTSKTPAAQPTGKNSVIDLTRKSKKTTSSNTATKKHNQRTSKTPQTKQLRQFEIPKQSDDGKRLQLMLRRAAVDRRQNYQKRADIIKKNCVEQYTVQRKVSDTMARKVGACHVHTSHNNMLCILHTIIFAHICVMQVAQRIVSGIFTYGSLLDTSAVLVRVLQAPELREMAIVGRNPEERTQKYWTTLQAIVENVAEYLTVLQRTKGARTTANEQSYRTVLAACSSGNLGKHRCIHQAGIILVCAHACYERVHPHPHPHPHPHSHPLLYFFIMCCFF